MKRVMIFMVLIPQFLFAQTAEIDSLDAFLAKQVKDYKVPGLAIGIMKNGKVLFKKGYGVNSITENLPINTATVFPISSCTKAFTVAALAILVDEEKLKWDDKVIKYLPNFKLSDPWITKNITISDILSHRSGLASWEGDLLWYGTNYTRKEIIKKIQFSPISGNFRADFGYQNIMYLVAGMVIEKISGKTWDDFIAEKIFKPLAMNGSSTSVHVMQQLSNYAHPHLKNKPINLVSLDNIAPAGAVNSNIDDMMKWMQVWVGKGRIGDAITMSENAWETITSIKTLTSSNADNGYGFGWYIGYKNGRKEISHNGTMPGYRSSVVFYPESGSGVVILTNKISPISEQLLKVMERYLFTSGKTNWNLTDQDMAGKRTVYKWDRIKDDRSDLKPAVPYINKFVGTYTDKIYGKALIKINHGQAILELLPAKKLFTGNLYYIDKNRFKIIFNDGFIPEGELVFKRTNNKNTFKIDIDISDFHFEELSFIENTKNIISNSYRRNK